MTPATYAQSIAPGATTTFGSIVNRDHGRPVWCRHRRRQRRGWCCYDRSNSTYRWFTVNGWSKVDRWGLANRRRKGDRRYAINRWSPADNTAHSYNLTWSSSFTESCTLPAGSSFDQTKILGFGFGIEAGPSPVQLSLLVSSIKFTGGGTSSPCSAYCGSPKDFTVAGSFSSGNLGNSAFCYQTTSNFNGGGCGNFVNPRTLNINGTQINCNAWSLPAEVNGGYCFYGNPGEYAWAYFGVW